MDSYDLYIDQAKLQETIHLRNRT